ncbi:MAG TPA: hypothetical protein VJN88_11060 [Ktedonobacterales bacterium]|nr:hypothetical protein [Ktedonobacterales bacterium]
MDTTVAVDSATNERVTPESALAHATPALGRLNLEIAALLAMIAFGAMIVLDTLVFHQRVYGVSNANHMVYQAEAFLHGRWDLSMGRSVTDIVVLHGKNYIVYPPMPAIVMMPFVAIWGLHFSDVLFTLVASSLNLGILYLMLEQARESGFTRRTRRDNIIMALFFYFGTINLWLSAGGRMWFTAHILCFSFTLLALLVAFRGRYGWGAALLGCAFFCRATAVFGFLFLFYLAWQNGRQEHLVERFAKSLWARRPDWSAVPWRRLLAPALVGVGMLLLFMLRNQVIFGNPFETGYDILIKQRYPVVTTGAFNVSYIPSNIVANFFTFPRVTFTGPYDRHPVIDMLNGNGVAISVFVTTPLFLLLFWRNRKFSLTRAALWATVGLVVVAVLLFHAAGFFQFGARYLFDGYPFAFLLLAMDDMPIDWRFLTLGILGVGVNLLGARQFWTFRIFHL